MKKFELVIDKYGVGLSVQEGQFYIRHKDSRQRIPVGKVRSIVLAKSTSVTGAAIKLALENDIDISFIERDGMPFARVWNSEFGSIATIRRRQLEFSKSKDGQQWIKSVITQKIQHQMALVGQLAELRGHTGASVEQVRNKFSSYLLKLSTTQTSDSLQLANQLRGWEANASRVYFATINQFLPKEWRFEKRSKRPALDPFNATLNYCYGILYNKIEAMTIRAGLDPHIGVFHTDQHKRPVLVFDIIELFRHWAEYPVVKAFEQGVFLAQHFKSHNKRGVRIEHDGKKLILEIFFAYLNEKVNWQNQSAKRITHIKLYIDQFAQKMKKYQDNAPKTSGI